MAASTAAPAAGVGPRPLDIEEQLRAEAVAAALAASVLDSARGVGPTPLDIEAQMRAEAVAAALAEENS